MDNKEQTPRATRIYTEQDIYGIYTMLRIREIYAQCHSLKSENYIEANSRVERTGGKSTFKNMWLKIKILIKLGAVNMFNKLVNKD